ncbi:MAG: amino acid racemase [Acidobacteriales bacterium]|nr:amino acid racemase [Terriglobales bacterium]
MAQHVGIVGCSAEGAALCYRTFCVEAAEVMGPHAHPEVSLHTNPLNEYMKCIYRDDWQGVAGLMLSSAEKLAKIGADFLISPDNTIHRALPFVVPRSPLPWLHIVEEVAKAAKEKGYRRLAVTGTRYTMEGPVYPEKLREAGLDYRMPEPVEQQEINRIIFDELVYSKFTAPSLRFFQQVITRLKGEGCDAVVLGCTEIPLLVSSEDSPLPTLDSTRLLARAAIRRAVGVEAAMAKPA